MLEPAGSHGVWGLDDYQCLVFLWGAAQLINNADQITPSSIHNPEILEKFSSEYMYLEGIHFIKKIKSSAPFAGDPPPPSCLHLSFVTPSSYPSCHLSLAALPSYPHLSHLFPTPLITPPSSLSKLFLPLYTGPLNICSSHSIEPSLILNA